MSTWNDFFNDMHVQNQARLDREARTRMLQRHTREMEEMAANYDGLAASAARYLAMREALTRQLARFDPKNPLVVDRALRLRISEAAEKDYLDKFNAGKGQDWDAVMAIGRNFPIPGRP